MVRYLVRCSVCAAEFVVAADSPRLAAVPDHEADGVVRPCPGYGRPPAAIQPKPTQSAAA